MTIKKIAIEEFIRVRKARESKRTRYGNATSPEGTAVSELQPGEAVTFPCRWTHHKQDRKPVDQCAGMVLAYQRAHRAKFKISGFCQDDMVYVCRHKVEGKTVPI